MNQQKPRQPPWASGPGEILQHGLGLLRSDTDCDRRLAMLSIDNAVELMIKTYLGLPARATGIKISRKEFEYIQDSFPGLIDALDRFFPRKLDGIPVAEIEWYHRLRNQLYHQGNGLTVERNKVEIYAELARRLFKNLFDYEIEVNEPGETRILGEFMLAWVRIVKAINALAVSRALVGSCGHPLPRSDTNIPESLPDELCRQGLLNSDFARGIEELRQIRAAIVHGEKEYKDILTAKIVKTADEIAGQLEAM